MKRMFKRRFRLITWGALGDQLLITPFLRVLKKKYPKSKIIVFCRGKDHHHILKNNPNIDSLRSSSMFFNPVNAILYTYKLVKFFTLSIYRYMPNSCGNKHAKEIVAETLDEDLNLADETLQVCFSKKEETKAKNTISNYKKTVIINITSKSSKNTMWEINKWEEIVQRFPNLTFIQLGTKNEEKIKGAIDLLGKTSIREAMALVKYAELFVGVNSFLAHATNAFGTRGVVIWGDTTPKVFGHSNNINIYKNLACSPCFDILSGGECPYDNRCTKEISVKEVEEAILQLYP